MATESHSESYLQRGAILREQGRYAEAGECFRQALSINPRNADALFNLALCQLNQKGQEKDALGSIDAAIQLEPEESFYHSIKSHIFEALERPEEALKAALKGVELDPTSSYAYTTKANGHLALQQWAEAETSARQALSLDADNSTAANLLACALRVQNKVGESKEHITGMLAKDPEDSVTHVNAGWTALHEGDREKAEQHFLEALRLDPDSDEARQGLIESFKSRSQLYRAYLNYVFFMQRISRNMQWALIIGVVIGIRFAQRLFVGKMAWLGMLLAGIYLLFVMWVHLATGIGNLLVLLDGFARHALTRMQKVEALAVGGGVLAGIVFLLAGMLLHFSVGSILGITLIGAAIPFAYTFTNRSVPGRLMFGLFACFILVTGILGIANALLSPCSLSSFIAPAVGISILLVVATTWLANFRTLRRT